jgi:hypothetical protein
MAEANDNASLKSTSTVSSLKALLKPERNEKPETTPKVDVDSSTSKEDREKMVRQDATFTYLSMK